MTEQYLPTATIDAAAVNKKRQAAPGFTEYHAAVEENRYGDQSTTAAAHHRHQHRHIDTLWQQVLEESGT